MNSAARRAGKAGGWIIPGLVIALMPKCPACFAAWIAVATGLGLSLPAASWLRAAILAGCFAILSLMLAASLAAWRRRHARACCH